MLGLKIGTPASGPLRLLCLGAHADDIEIGCGGTILKLCAEYPEIEVRWVVFSAAGARAAEARRSADLFLRLAARHEVLIEGFRDGFFPYSGGELKEYFEALKVGFTPDLIFTHHRADRHQDHRLISELTWNTFRDHLVLEYEIPKYDGDLGSPNLFVPLTPAQQADKLEFLMTAFPSQHEKHWFTAETFSGLMRLRGVESVAPDGFAEAFHARKVVLGY